MTLNELTTQTQTRLGDPDSRVWSRSEIQLHVQNGYRQLALELPIFWDAVYPENLPRGFSYTQPWEAAYVETLESGFDYGCANYVMDHERREVGDERNRIGPANHTSPFEATAGWLASVGASTAIPATVDLPATLTALDRVTWDERGIDAMRPAHLEQVDARYQITAGEVYGYTWKQDGVRTLRKVRVPSQAAATWTVNGSWGILRSVSDLSAETLTGAWGVPRRIAGQHPLGTESFGLPRRVYRDGTNVRVEFYRQGRPLSAEADVCELPTRYAKYLRDYAMGEALRRSGPGQDVMLADHFSRRWKRGVVRIRDRVNRLAHSRTLVLGGSGERSTGKPPRPSRPWAYGDRLR